MTEEIIIDDINVAGWTDEEVYYKFEHHTSKAIKQIAFDLYRQLKRLEQENNSLQAQLNNITVQSNNAITALEQERDELLEEVKQLHNGRSTEELYTLFGKPIKYWEELEQENKELKETIKQYCEWLDEERESNDKLQKVYQNDHCDLLRYRSALEETREKVKNPIVLSCFASAKFVLEQIDNKINEVLK